MMPTVRQSRSVGFPSAIAPDGQGTRGGSLRNLPLISLPEFLAQDIGGTAAPPGCGWAIRKRAVERNRCAVESRSAACLSVSALRPSKAYPSALPGLVSVPQGVAHLPPPALA